MSSGVGVKGTLGRCYPFFADLKKCVVSEFLFASYIVRVDSTQLLVDAFTFTDDVLTKGAILLFTYSLNVEYPYSLHPYFCTLF